MKRGGPIRRKKTLSAAQHLTRRIVKAKRATVTAAERNTRKIVKARSGEVCEVCGKAPFTQMHHRKKAGRVWSPSNVLAVCGLGNYSGCHAHIELNPTASKQQGWWLVQIQVPEDEPVWLAGRGRVFLHDDGSITPEELAA